MTSPSSGSAGASPGAVRQVVDHVAAAVERFFRMEAASGVLLIFAAAVALLWANSGWADAYHSLWQTTIGVNLHGMQLERSLLWLVNDGLMAIFFFVVGLEIRRELHDGELSQWRRASLPVVAAIGGVVVPASIYLLLAGGGEARSGWGVPMATDIAFAIGILALLGKRVPPSLRVLLLAVAVIDDLVAILVIAVFYSSGISVVGALVAALAFAAVLLMRRLGVRSPLAYVLPAVVAWAGVYAAGVHPTIAGVILGLLTPVAPWMSAEQGVALARRHGAELAQLAPPDQADADVALAAHLTPMHNLRRDVRSPVDALIDALHPWVAYGIMPMFALANAGVSFAGPPLPAAATTVATAVGLALLLGKPAGVLLASGLALRLRVSAMPTGMAWRHLVVLGAVTGVGFTMSLFIAQLAFRDESLLAAAKTGVLLASGAAAALTLLLGRLLLPSSAASAR